MNNDKSKALQLFGNYFNEENECKLRAKSGF